MAAIIIGSPSATLSAANAKVLRRQQYQKDLNGLESLSETYIIRTENRISIAPAKDTKHSDFSTATLKFSRMASETISFTEMDGGLTEMNINFVGLTSSSGLPPAVVRIVPVTGAGIYGPPINIEVDYVSDSSETELLKGTFTKFSFVPANIFLNSFSKKMPSSINGTLLPEDPRPPFTNETRGGLYIRYEGYVLKGMNFVRRGQFLTATAVFAENQVVVI